MNKTRRQELYDVVSHLDEAIERIEEIKNDEQDAFDAIPEGFQNSASGDAMQVAMDQLDGFIDEIETIKSRLKKMIKGE